MEIQEIECHIPTVVNTLLSAVGLGDIRIYCHDISWQKVSQYYYISRYFIFSQPETNYVRNRGHYSSGYINSYTLHEVYIQTFKQPFVIKSM